MLKPYLKTAWSMEFTVKPGVCYLFNTKKSEIRQKVHELWTHDTMFYSLLNHELALVSSFRNIINEV